MKSTIQLFGLLLFIMIGSRLSITYFDQSRILQLPEWNFASQYSGRDLQNYSIKPIYDLEQKKTPYIFGYGSVFFSYICIRMLGMSEQAVFVLIVASGVIGLILLLWITISNQYQRTLATLFLAAFMLGIPMNKAIEAGNIDLVLSVLFGIAIICMQKKTSLPVRIGIGVLLGILISSKAFFLPFVCISLLFSHPSVAIYAAITYGAISLWPRLFGVPSGLFDVFNFALRENSAAANQIYTQINYGNNAILSYVSNTFQSLHMQSPIFVVFGTTLLVYLIIIKPLVDEKVFSKTYIVSSFKSFPFMLLLYSYASIIVLTATAWSYDYRILYNVPIVFILISLARDQKTKQLIYLSMASLLIKSLWIPKDRIMTIFLYIHAYYLLRAAISLWTNHTSKV